MIRCNSMLTVPHMLEDYQRYHVHVETCPVDQQGGSWLSGINLQTFMLT